MIKKVEISRNRNWNVKNSKGGKSSVVLQWGGLVCSSIITFLERTGKETNWDSHNRQEKETKVTKAVGGLVIDLTFLLLRILLCILRTEIFIVILGECLRISSLITLVPTNLPLTLPKISCYVYCSCKTAFCDHANMIFSVWNSFLSLCSGITPGKDGGPSVLLGTHSLWPHDFIFS